MQLNIFSAFSCVLDVFTPKIRENHATYEVISRYHSNRVSPNVANMCLRDKRTGIKDGMS